MVRGNEKYKKRFNKYIDDEDSFERNQLADVLEKNHWNKSKTAKELKIGRTTLWRKMKQLGLAD